MDLKEFQDRLAEAGLTIQDLESFCLVMYSPFGKKSKNPIPTLRAIFKFLNISIQVHFKRYDEEMEPGLNVRMKNYGDNLHVWLNFKEEDN